MSDEPYNYFTDATAPGKQFTPPEFKVHLKEAHGIDAVRGVRTMLSHIDGDTWFMWGFRWDIEGKIFEQHTRNNRAPQRMHHDYE